MTPTTAEPSPAALPINPARGALLRKAHASWREGEAKLFGPDARPGTTVCGCARTTSGTPSSSAEADGMSSQRRTDMLMTGSAH